MKSDVGFGIDIALIAGESFFVQAPVDGAFPELSLPLAMRVYSSWTERIFSMDGVENLLLLGMIVTALLVPILARRRPAAAAYFSGLFALSLCPFLFAALVVLYRVHSLLEYEDTASGYVLERLHFPRQILLFGIALTLFSYGVYSAIYLLKRKARWRSGKENLLNRREAFHIL